MTSLATEVLHLRRRETVPRGMVRIARARLEASLSELQGVPRATAIHGVRKQCKQLRALLRLVRSELGAKAYAQEDARFRELARPLGGVRDAEVLAATLTSLVLRHPELARGRFARLRRAMRVRRDALLAEALAPRGGLEQAATQLQDAQATLAHWTLNHRGWKALGIGLKRSYRRGRRAMQRAVAEPSDATLHRWRKEAKVLHAQLAALKPRWPRAITQAIDDLEALGDLLGGDHDLAILRQAVGTAFASALDPSEAHLLQTMIAHRRAALQKKALRRGARCFAERPSVFEHTLHAHWSAWRDA